MRARLKASAGHIWPVGSMFFMSPLNLTLSHLCLPFSVSLSFFLSLSTSLSVYLSLYLSLCPPLSMYTSLSVYLSLSVYVTLCILSTSLFVYLSSSSLSLSWILSLVSLYFKIKSGCVGWKDLEQNFVAQKITFHPRTQKVATKKTPKKIKKQKKHKFFTKTNRWLLFPLKITLKKKTRLFLSTLTRKLH